MYRMESRILIGFSQRKDKNEMFFFHHGITVRCMSVFNKHLDVHIIDSGTRTFYRMLYVLDVFVCDLHGSMV